ncbi:MAG: NUDIX domain-containing protein, partial [Clostridia bacterium]|nr:NUDIX domain-containing protein [Clostridia bacterium]
MTDYIRSMRALVGHRPILQVGASVIPVNEAGEVLLERRTDNHSWGYPGGSVELDEVVEDAARRELYEETGLVAQELTLFGIFSGPDTHYVYPNGDEVSNVDIVYLCRKYLGTPRPQPEEVEALAWFLPDALPDDLSPPIRKPLLAWAEKRIAGKPSVKRIEILGDNRFETFDITRDGCRGIVLRDGKILLSCETKTDWWLLPGGGLENGETLAACCEREVGEETGFLVSADRHVLTLYEYYENVRYGSHYFLCSVTGQGGQRLTEEEKKRGLIPAWLPVEEAAAIFSEHRCYADTNEEKRGSYLREYTALC